VAVATDEFQPAQRSQVLKSRIKEGGTDVLNPDTIYRLAIQDHAARIHAAEEQRQSRPARRDSSPASSTRPRK
jgi:hypothetical protein